MLAMKKITLGIATLLSLACILLNNPQSVHACTPIYSTPQEDFDRADAVFLGRVLSVETSSQGDTRIVTGSVQVDKYWKGDVGRNVQITSSGIYTCAPGFGPDAKDGYYLIYANRTSQSQNIYSVGMLGMKPVASISDATSALGVGRDTVQSPEVYTFRFNRDLTIGSGGTDVVQMQNWLENKGFLVMPPGISKGYFGSLTRTALIRYQISQGINPAVGYFGPLTRARINNSSNSNNSSAKISPDFLPDGYINPPNQQIDSTYYNQKLTASGFLKPGLKWEVVSGSLPSGFYLSKNSISCIPENPCDPNYETWQAVIGGRTQSTGVYTFTVRASSGSQSVDKTYTITIKNSPTQSSIYIIQPVINETWQIGTPHPIQWKLNTDQSTLRGSLFLTVFLQDSSGNLINAQAGQQIQKDQNSTTISIPYFASPAIMPGNYHLVFKIYDTIAALPCVGCQGYSKLVASATTTAIVTLTASDGKVAPAITSLSVTNGRIGDSISVNGVAFQNDSKIFFERLNPLDGQARIKISLTPQIVSSNKLTFTIPSGCTNSDVCNPQNSSVTSGVYYVSVQTQYGTSNVSGIQVTN